MISTLIKGSPARRRTNPITRCRDQPHSAMQGPTTDEAPTNGLTKTTHADERTFNDDDPRDPVAHALHGVDGGLHALTEQVS